VVIDLCYSEDKSLIEAAHRLAGHDNPLVRGGGIWALKQLMDNGAFSALAAKSKPLEADPQVQSEWGGQS
jgi:epoxyqueuosine reductase